MDDRISWQTFYSKRGLRFREKAGERMGYTAGSITLLKIFSKIYVVRLSWKTWNVFGEIDDIKKSMKWKLSFQDICTWKLLSAAHFYLYFESVYQYIRGRKLMLLCGNPFMKIMLWLFGNCDILNWVCQEELMFS